MYIDDADVKLLLETNRDEIGHSYSIVEGLEMIVSGIMFIISNAFTDYNIKIIPNNITNAIVTNTILSNLSNIPPCPGIKLEKSLTP